MVPEQSRSESPFEHQKEKERPENDDDNNPAKKEPIVPLIPTSQERVLRITLSPELNQVLANLVEHASVQENDVVRRAIVLMGIAIGAKQDGLKVAIVGQNHEFITEISGL